MAKDKGIMDTLGQYKPEKSPDQGGGSVRLNRQGGENADAAGNATGGKPGRQLPIDKLHTDGGSAALPKKAGE